MKMEDVSREEWIVGGLALLVAISLLFFPFYSVSASFAGVTVSASSSGTGAPDGWLGVLGLLAAIAILAELAMRRFSPQTRIPDIGGERVSTRTVLAGIVAATIVLKILFNGHIGNLGWGCFVDLVGTAALLYLSLNPGAMPTPTVGGGTAAPPTA